MQKLDNRQTIKKHQNSSHFFHSFSYVFEDYLHSVPGLLFKTIEISEYLSFNRNDFNEAKKEDKMKSLMIYQMGISMKLEDKAKQITQLNKIKSQTAALQSKNQILHEQIGNQQQQIEILLKKYRIVDNSNQDVVNPLAILYQWIHSQRETLFGQNIGDHDQLCTIPETSVILELSSRKNEGEQSQEQNTRKESIRSIVSRKHKRNIQKLPPISKQQSTEYKKTESIILQKKTDSIMLEEEGMSLKMSSIIQSKKLLFVHDNVKPTGSFYIEGSNPENAEKTQQQIMQKSQKTHKCNQDKQQSVQNPLENKIIQSPITKQSKQQKRQKTQNSDNKSQYKIRIRPNTPAQRRRVSFPDRTPVPKRKDIFS